MKQYKITKSFTHEGKRYYVHGDTEKETIMKMANKLRDLEEGKITYNGDMLVKDWAKKCIETYKTTLAPSTLSKYKSRMQHSVLDHLGKLKVKDVKPLQCQQVLNMQLGNSKWQIGEVERMMKLIFGKAVENKMILENPAAHLSRPMGTKSSRRSLTEQERIHFLKICQSDKFILFLLMYYCGCRPSEARNAMGLDIKRFKQENETYDILHIRGTKTAQSDRLVPIPAELMERISKTPKFSYIATNETGKKFDDESYRRLLSRLKREMNISMGCNLYRNALVPPYPLAEDFVPYCLRHTYCTDLQKKGVDLRTAQYLMGHADVRMTANIYTHADSTTIIEAAKLISGVAPPVTPQAISVEK